MAAASLVVRVSAQIAEFQKSFADLKRTTDKFASDFEGIATRAAAVGSFIGNIAAKIATSLASAFGQGLRDAIRLSSEFQNAFIGLNSVARAFGVDADRASEAARRLSSDGLLPLKDSATSLKNLLAAGFNLEQSTNLMLAFKDAAAFGRQSALSFGDAIRSATEGVKNGNSILVDNAGITKNLSQILKEAGFAATDLSRVQSDAAVRLALYNGILKESLAFQGDAERLTQTYSGAVSRLSFAYDNLLVTLGSTITQNETVARVIQAVADAFFGLNTQLTNNRNAFNLISDGVIFLVRAFAETLNVIDLIQTGFTGLQQASNRLFEAFINIGIAALKVYEQLANVAKFIEPQRWQQHAATAQAAAEAYQFLQGAAQGLRDASRDAEARSAAFGNTLQEVRFRATSLATELEKTRGKTVQLGEQARPAMQRLAGALGEGSDATKSFVKNLNELTAEIDLANRNYANLATLVEVFGSAADKAATKADAWGIAVSLSVREVANAFREAKFNDFLADFFDKQAKASKKHWDGIVKDVEEAGKRWGDAFLKNFDVQRGVFKDLEALEADSLAKRLRVVRKDAEDRRAQLNRNSSNYEESLAVIDQLERRSAELATFEWEQHVSDTKRSMNTFSNIFRDVLGEIPNLIKSAFTGGGGFAGAISAITSSLGSALGGKAFGELAAKLNNTLVKTFGVAVTSALGTIIPGIGAVLGSLIGPDLISGLVKGFNSLVGKISELPKAAKIAFAALLPIVGIPALFANRGRDLVKDFAKSFGGFDALRAKLAELGSEGERLWVKLTQGVGRNNPQQAKAAIDEVTKALDAFGTEAERAQRRFAGIGTAIEGVNRKAELFADPFRKLLESQKALKDNADADPLQLDAVNAKLAEMGQRGQAEFERIGVFAAAAFAGFVKESGDALGAIQKLGPAFQVLKDGVTQFGLTSTGTIDALIGMFDLVNDAVTGPILQSIQATGQIFAGLKDGALLTAELFQIVATDIGASFRELEAKGGDVAKAMALSQPILQRLWEGQQLYGEITDETTRKILDQAREQGLVGDHMKDVNQKILDVLIAIADVFRADIPESFRKTKDAARDAARVIEDELAGIKAPPEIRIPVGFDVGEIVLPNVTMDFDVPQLARGGIVRRPTLALIGEAGPEAVVPLSHMGTVAQPGSSTVILEVDGRTFAEVIVPHLPGAVRRRVHA